MSLLWRTRFQLIDRIKELEAELAKLRAAGSHCVRSERDLEVPNS